MFKYTIIFTFQEDLEEAIIEKYTKKYGQPESRIESEDKRYHAPTSSNLMVNAAMKSMMKMDMIVPNCKIRISKETLSWKNKNEVKEIAELLIEKSIDDHDKIVINASGLKLELQFTDFMYQVCRMLKEDFSR